MAYLKHDEPATINDAVGKGRLAGVVTQHQMHEQIAALYEGAPWLAPALAVMMAAMNRATQTGPAALTMAPLILAGPPGIGKSQWGDLYLAWC